MGVGSLLAFIELLVSVSDPTRSCGKLAPNWEGPYRVVEVVREGTYTLATMEGRVLSRT
ncbi:hypothetical protein B296_00011348 [Ensete ventricosum]|uniref:Reverse transcriptase domain-containing protein n=1 Tax=Ensete ventricosum TaxID=4639 RepID=A0A427A979_ENSVE|nr:hypothetical protein B296_00011348 [Ensete ventricosum]